VAVTGAAGHVGANLVRNLLAEDRTVRVLRHRSRRAIDGLDVKVVDGDICDAASLRRVFDGAEVVYHLAANISLSMLDWSKLEVINVIGTRNVVEACLECGVRRLVHFSSIHAFRGKPECEPIDESRSLVDSRGYCPPYDRSKVAGEREVIKGIEKGLDAIIISPTAVIGPYDYQPSHFGKVLLALARRKMLGLVTGGFDWVDARDVVQGAMRAEKQAPTGMKYLLSGHWVSVRDVAAIVAEVTGVPPPRMVYPIWLAYIGAPFATALARLGGERPLFTTVSLRALTSHRHISHDRASRELGYQPRPFKETIADTLRWFEEDGQLNLHSGMKSEESH